MYTCPICAVNPSSHSLIKIADKGIVYFYTCPAKATAQDVKGIIHHYHGVLSEIPKNKEWIWIVDSEGFSLNHFMQINVAIELAKLISTFSNLKKIIIINPNLYITTIHNILPFKLNIEILYEVRTAEEVIEMH